MIIWYSGALDDRYGYPTVNTITVNPVVLRGVDLAGNLIREIHLNDLYPDEFGTVEAPLASQLLTLLRERTGIDHRFVEGFREDGAARVLFRGASGTPWDSVSYTQEQKIFEDFAVDTDGRIYCAMASSRCLCLRPGYTQEMLLSAINNTNWGSDVTNTWGIPLSVLFDYWEPYMDIVNGYPDWPESLEEVYYYDQGYYYQNFIDFFRVYRENGDRITDFPSVHTRPVRAVTVDQNGYFYIAGEPDEDNYFLKKYTTAGVLTWSAEHVWPSLEYEYQRYFEGYPAYQVPARWIYTVPRSRYNLLIDGSGNVFVAGSFDINTNDTGITAQDNLIGTIFLKYNSSGVLQWQRRIYRKAPWAGGGGFDFYYRRATNLVTDGTYFYLAVNGGKIPSVSSILSTEHQVNFYSDGTDEYSFNPAESLIDIMVWDTDGDIIESVASPLDEHFGIRALAYDDGKLYCSLLSTTSYDEDYSSVLIYDVSTWVLQSTVPALEDYQYAEIGNNSYPWPEMAFDADNNQYLTGMSFQVGAYGILNAFDDTGTRLWTSQSAIEYPAAWKVHAVRLVQVPQLPALALPLHLGMISWIGDQYLEMPGLAFPISLAIPTWIREYVGIHPLPDVYRLYLDGTPALDIKPNALTLRRTLYGRQLTAIGCALSIADLEAMTERIGNTLSLYRGVRFADGTEQLEVMMEVVLETVRGDQGSNAFSCTVEGRTEETTTGTGTRALRGISYRNSSGGQRRLRCAIDTYLRPGDTATWGGSEFLIVREITLSISPNNAVMEITE